MTELNFCPSCDSAGHRIARFNDKLCYCKVCSTFFNLEFMALKCPKCDNKKIKTSDFPSPKGELVFHCQNCKNLINASEFFKKNGVKV